MLSEELSTDMLQDAILDLLTLTHTSIEYITTRAAFVSPSPDIPIYSLNANIAPAAEYNASIKEFVAGIVQRSKDIQTLIAALPKKDDSHARAERLQELQAEMIIADREYAEALAEAEQLLTQVQTALSIALEEPAARDPALASLAKDLRTSTETSGPSVEPPDDGNQRIETD